MLNRRENATSTVVATINNQKIEVFKEGNESFVAIKSLCDALGINPEPQVKKLKEDEILSSTTTLRVAVGGDEKLREMFCIPAKYVFGWLFTINPKNVAPEAKESVIRYKKACYDALYEHFVLRGEFYNEKELLITKAKLKLSEAKQIVFEAKQELNEIQAGEFEDWKAEKAQLAINFNEGGQDHA